VLPVGGIPAGTLAGQCLVEPGFRQLIDEARSAIASMGHDFDAVVALEVDPASATAVSAGSPACFLDSLATLQFPATGYGIRYDYGIFTQSMTRRARQRESASTWLRLHNVWETPRSDARYIVRFGGRVLTTHDVGGGALALGGNAGCAGGGVRSAGARQSQPDGESSAPVVRGGRCSPFHIEDFKRRQLSGRGRGSGRGQESLARAVSGRLQTPGFPSLYCYQELINIKYRDIFDIDSRLKNFFSNLDHDSYLQLLRDVLLGNSAPENVILLEIEPDKQKTRIDFSCTEKWLDIKPVSVTEIIKNGKDLYYTNNGKKNKNRTYLQSCYFR